MDRVAEFIEELQSEFIVLIIELSTYSLMSNYMQLLQGEIVSAHTNIAMQFTYITQ
ncbi:12119_t:CDS:2 [Funneliformis caledonium]|uniref:12119_t:CDS:1 n=1 Tax=Funneliformis caledonium TaxID=1117310 RepID=A0A9N9CGR4_9GLOM|nr:12119_t:CDS:2 [Funneliformis caledonium]